ncbi:PREDICTED: glutathione S-transferase T3-like [Brassica oleracea var. oleracea]|uniref:glutathione S-transferase T3-like n=1 Tax=Brassica oleracea var. oleracea TaxID=109376 RepID=UPI0006A72289|nr:PREDICTED: glutathione S-transferase T3-like [Brassica oleracea var. oleracea]
MDSKNLPTQSSSYVGLHNSQQGSVLHENFPYESYHSSVHFPPFSSQQSDAPPLPEDTPVDRKERRKWSPADDEVLISVWLNTSKDAVVGNEQKKRTFWKRVGEYYAASPHGREDGEKREHLHSERQISSGQNDTSILKMAHDIFYSDHNIKFNLEHAWCVLRFEQKWFSLNTPKSSGCSKRKNGETCSQTSSTNVSDHEIRPKGAKAAKSKRNTA